GANVAENGTLFADWPLAEASPVTQSAAKMGPPRFEFIDRRQSFFSVVDVESLIEEDHAARAIWNVVEELDLSAFHEQTRAMEGAAGRPATDPRLLISLWIYAYSQGVGAAREISRFCEYHPAYRWLRGAESISGHTLSTFRVEHKDALERLFVE